MGISKEHFQGVPGCGPCRSIPTFAFGLFLACARKIPLWLDYAATVLKLLGFERERNELSIQIIHRRVFASVWRKINESNVIYSDGYSRPKDRDRVCHLASYNP